MTRPPTHRAQHAHHAHRALTNRARLAEVAGRARPGALVAAALASLVLAGCTVGGEPPAPTEDAAPPASVGSKDPTPSDTPDGPTPEELSEDLLAAAAVQPEPLGSVTAVVPPQDVETTMEVLEVRAVDGATHVVLRLSAPGGTFNVGLNTFAEGRFGSQSFVRDVYLDDVDGGTRYLPFQFQDSREACVCPYKPLELGTEPQVVTALFPALPEGTATVDVRLASTDLVLPGLPVG